MAIEIQNLCKTFGDKKVLHNLNMRLEDGGIYCLMGPSGMGKTTLLRIIMQLETKDSGKILWTDANGSREVDPNTEISAMFQEDRLLPFLSAVENVNMMYEKKRPVRELKEDLSQILPKKCLTQPACELSGGMKRRVSLARTMHFQGKMIILDEPFTGLDVQTRKQVIDYILKNRRDRILLVATHGVDDAALLGAEVIRLEECQDVKALQAGRTVHPQDAKAMRREKEQQLMELLPQIDTEQLGELVSFMERLPGHGAEQRRQEAIEQIVRQWDTPVMDGVPQTEWSRALGMLDGEKKSYAAGEVLWNVKDTCTAFPVILAGKVAACMIDGKGRESLIGEFGEGHCFGEMLVFRGVPSPVIVKAVEPSTIMYLSKERLMSNGYDSKEAFRNTLLWKILGDMSDKLAILADKLDMMGGSIEEKLLAYLRKMPEDADGSRILDRTQKEIANYLQIPTPSLSRTLTTLELRGQILREGPNRIRLLK